LEKADSPITWPVVFTCFKACSLVVLVAFPVIPGTGAELKLKAAVHDISDRLFR
jgi:hypothetical protein